MSIEPQAFDDETQRARLVMALVELRLRQGITQAEVAGRMGVTQPTVSDFERNGQEGRVSSLSLIQRYARAVGARVRTWVEEPTSDPLTFTFADGSTVTADRAEVLTGRIDLRGRVVEPPTGKAEGSGGEDIA